MSELFSVGDFVRLTIGGETMAIVRHDELQPAHWICLWVDSKGVVQMSSIAQHLLKYVGPGKPETQARS